MLMIGNFKNWISDCIENGREQGLSDEAMAMVLIEKSGGLLVNCQMKKGEKNEKEKRWVFHTCVDNAD